MPDFPAIGHVAVTVKDLTVSRPWYQQLIGADPVLDEDTGAFYHVVWKIGGTLLGIHQHPRLESSEPCSELRPGLDHIAFGVANRAELEAWEKRLDGLGVKHDGIVDAPYGSGLSFRDPDNIPLEFFAPAG